MPGTRSQQKENDSADQQHREVVPESASVASSTPSFHGFAEWETAMEDATRKEFDKAVWQRAQVKMKLDELREMIKQEHAKLDATQQKHFPVAEPSQTKDSIDSTASQNHITEDGMIHDVQPGADVAASSVAPIPDLVPVDINCHGEMKDLDAGKSTTVADETKNN